MPDELSSLEDVYVFANSDEPLPPMAVIPRSMRILGFFAEPPSPKESERHVSRTVLRELGLLVSSLRQGGPPSSVLLSLIMEDGQTIGSIAASVERDVEDVEASVLALQEESWVQVQQEDHVDRVRLLLAGPEQD